MTKSVTLLAAGLALSLAGASATALAANTLNGAWDYKVGASAACTVTLTPGADEHRGNIASSAACPGGLVEIAHWHVNGQNLELSSNSGDLVAILHKTATGFGGDQVDGGRKIALTPAGPGHIAAAGS